MSPPASARQEARLEIKNRLGLHARAARLLVEAVRGLDADITVHKDDQTVNGKSIIGLMMLAAGQGSILDITAEGPDATKAIEVITALVDDNFQEDS